MSSSLGPASGRSGQAVQPDASTKQEAVGAATGRGFLFDVRVLELADEKGEFCGKLLAGAGADVIKVEPPGGSPTRRIGPFYQDREDPERSLHFWHYNFGKRGITLDIMAPAGQAELKRLVAGADVLLESHAPGYLDSLGLGYKALRAINPRLIMASITPFGQTGPYRNWKGSDLVSLAMGGVMALTGYDPKPSGEYDTPPIAPQMWHASHVVGNQTCNAILAALIYRERAGRGQYIDASMHRAINCNTGSDIAHWVFSRKLCLRQTARYGEPRMLPETLAMTKDGRYVLAFVSAEFRLGREHKQWIEMMDKDGMADDLTDPKYQDLEYVLRPEVTRHFHAVARRWVSRYKFEDDIWKQAQGRRMHWAPVRRPEENLADPHWRQRQTFTEVRHEDIGRTFTYSWAPWRTEESLWRAGPRAPHLGEHNVEVMGAALPPVPLPASGSGSSLLPLAIGDGEGAGGVRLPPFALDKVRILDLAWVVAGAAGPRVLVGFGAEDIRVEWKGRLDSMRSGGTVIPVGEERKRLLAGESFVATRVGINQGGTFHEVNPGKRSISLNLAHPKGKDLLKELVRVCDIVVENFTARTMEGFGLGYEELRKVNPSIIYVQQPGFGKKGLYANYLSSAPVGEAFTGLTEMSGLPTPYPPAGWGYLYMDNSGSYYCAMAMLNALYYRARTGKGQYIDSSLAEPALYMSGTTILDYQANGRSWRRVGNRSPWKLAAPHGAYRCKGEDRWIAIAVFTEEEWRALRDVLGGPAWAKEERFATLASRLADLEALDAAMQSSTRDWEAFDLMARLQAAGVAAGVCQNTEDRMTRDPQLRHDGFMTEVANTEVGQWPVRQFPIKLSETPSRAGGTLARGFPCYAEDNPYVYGTLLGITDSDQRRLAEEDVI